MADLHRLIWLVLVGSVLAIFAPGARAENTCGPYINTSPYPTKSDALAAANLLGQTGVCNAQYDRQQCIAGNPSRPDLCGGNNPNYYVRYDDPNKKLWVHFEVTGPSYYGSQTSVYDPFGTYYTYATQCAAGEVLVNGVCTNPCASVSGQAPNSLTCTGASCRFFASSSTVRSVCVPSGGSNCLATGSLTLAWWDAAQGLWGIDLYDNKFNGTSCTPTNPTPTTNPDAPAPSTTPPPGDISEDHTGKCPGTVNGVTVWVECSNTKTEDKKTTTNGDGSSTQTKEQTQCKDGICTSTVQGTVTSSTGTTSTSTSTTTASQGTYCKDHPQDPQCGDTSSWGGSCTAGFQCNGDAVMCAAAKGVWEQKCALVDGTSAERTKYENAKASEASGTVPGLTTTTVAISSASFDTSNALGVTGSCALTRTVTVWGHPVSLPFDQVCDALQRLGQVLMLVGFLLAIRIVGKGD